MTCQTKPAYECGKAPRLQPRCHYLTTTTMTVIRFSPYLSSYPWKADYWSSMDTAGNSCHAPQMSTGQAQSHPRDSGAPCTAWWLRSGEDCRSHHSGSSAACLVWPADTVYVSIRDQEHIMCTQKATQLKMHCCVLCTQPVLLTYDHFNHHAQPTLHCYLSGGTKSNCKYSQRKKKLLTQYSRARFWFHNRTCCFVKHRGPTN